MEKLFKKKNFELAKYKTEKSEGYRLRMFMKAEEDIPKGSYVNVIGFLNQDSLNQLVEVINGSK